MDGYWHGHALSRFFSTYNISIFGPHDVELIGNSPAILQIRIYGLYLLRRDILVGMLIFYIASSCVSAWIIGSQLQSIFGESVESRKKIMVTDVFSRNIPDAERKVL